MFFAKRVFGLAFSAKSLAWYLLFVCWAVFISFKWAELRFLWICMTCNTVATQYSIMLIQLFGVFLMWTTSALTRSVSGMPEQKHWQNSNFSTCWKLSMNPKKTRSLALQGTPPPPPRRDTISQCYCQYTMYMPTLFAQSLVISNSTSTHQIWLQK